MERLAAEQWIEERFTPVGAIELVHERPWSTVLRVPLADGVAWFKACSSAEEFEPRFTTDLFERWPDRVPEVLDVDKKRGWLLLADAGTRIGDLGNLPRFWFAILPLYAELQRGETTQSGAHLAYGVPDLRVNKLPTRYEELLNPELPVASDDRHRLRDFAPRFEQLCSELVSASPPDTIQHDDLHMNNVYTDGERLRVLDWGDSSISHPFASLVPTFRFLEEGNDLVDGDLWIARIRDAYLEP